MSGGDTLTCWPKGFLTREEAEALLSLAEIVARDLVELTVEDETAMEKLTSALGEAK